MNSGDHYMILITKFQKDLKTRQFVYLLFLRVAPFSALDGFKEKTKQRSSVQIDVV